MLAVQDRVRPWMAERELPWMALLRVLNGKQSHSPVLEPGTLQSRSRTGTRNPTILNIKKSPVN